MKQKDDFGIYNFCEIYFEIGKFQMSNDLPISPTKSPTPLYLYLTDNYQKKKILNLSFNIISIKSPFGKHYDHCFK